MTMLNFYLLCDENVSNLKLIKNGKKEKLTLHWA